MPFILETNTRSSGVYREDILNNSKVDISISVDLHSISHNVTYLVSMEILYRIYRSKQIIGKQITKAGLFVITTKEENSHSIDDIIAVKAPQIIYEYARKKIKSFWLLMDYPPFAIGDYDFSIALEEKLKNVPPLPKPIITDTP